MMIAGRAALLASGVAVLLCTAQQLRAPGGGAVRLEEGRALSRREPGFIAMPGGAGRAWGPVWYGDTRVYGARVGADFARQPYPVYTDYMAEGDARSAGIQPAEQGDATRELNMPDGYMEGFAKDFFAYFPKESRAGEEVPDPIQAGYWPYATPDGLVAAGDAGARGATWRDFAREDSKTDVGVAGPQEQPGAAGDADDMEEYLDAESAAYTNDLRFYLEVYPGCLLSTPSHSHVRPLLALSSDCASNVEVP